MLLKLLINNLSKNTIKQLLKIRQIIFTYFENCKYTHNSLKTLYTVSINFNAHLKNDYRK